MTTESDRKMTERKQELRGLSAFELEQLANKLFLRRYKKVAKAILVDSIVDIEFKVNWREGRLSNEPANRCYGCGQTNTKRVDDTTWDCAYCGEYAVKVKTS